MRLFSFLFGNKNKHEDIPLIISQYSNLPRFYTINRVKYDIDNPKDIAKIPLFSKTFFINGVEYGMDSVLLEHGRQAYSQNIAVHRAAIDKANEFRYSGIIFKTRKEKDEDKQREERYRLQALEAEVRKKQCDSFKIDDMYQFEDIPFEWKWVRELNHTDGIAWFMLNTNNQYIALQYIDMIDKLITSAHEYIPSIRQFEFFAEEIDFDYPIPMHKNSVPITYVECVPYTKTGKLSKYPVILHFGSSENEKMGDRIFQWHPYWGTIKIMQDGSIGMANITFSPNHTNISIGLYGSTLIIKRIDSDVGTLYKYTNDSK